MDKIVLNAQKRETTGKAMRAEAEKRIPAVIYGQGKDATMVWLDSTEFKRVFAQAGTNTIVSVSIEGVKKPVDVLVYDFQNDPVTHLFTHIDLYAVDMKEEVEAEIPLTFTGVAAAVKELGGTLVKNVDQVAVRALPAKLPHDITVDLSKLATFEDHITAANLSVDKDVTIMIDSEVIIASVSEPRSAEELESLNDAVDADVSKVEGVVKDTDAPEEEEKK